jgi:hypothetical protein
VVRGTISDVTPTSTPPPSASARPATSAETLTHGCARVGAPVGPGVGLCEDCNPIGLRDSAASQVHGTAFLAVVIGVVVLAVLARLSVSGLGPFPATVDAVVADATGLAVTMTVTNEGDGTGQTTCRVAPVADRSTAGGAFVLSPRLGPGETRTFTSVVTGLGTDPIDLTVACRTP